MSSGLIDTQLLLSGEMALGQTEEALKRMIAGEAMKVSINPELSDE